jgi:hypothetical protein
LGQWQRHVAVPEEKFRMSGKKQIANPKARVVNRLSDAQLVLLSAAAQRADRLVVLDKAGPSARRAVGKLLRRGLLAEAPAQAGQQLWREDESGRPVAARISEDGLKVLGIEDAPTAETPPALEPGENGGGAVVKNRPLRGKPGTKRALIVGMLRHSDGASLADLMAATGWLPHTSRAALSGLRRRGFVLEKSRRADGTPVYLISDAGSDPREVA